MVVIIFDKLSESQRGYMSRISIEVKKNVFICDVSTRVREKLWEKISIKWSTPSILLYSINCEQGYKILFNKVIDLKKRVHEYDGVDLVSL